jgi:NADPH:quinone reductase-like Zn-dependent oxidoreductase
VLYGQGLAERVRAAAGGPVDAVFDVAGKTPVQELISLAPEPSQVVSIANHAAGQAGARVTGGGADSHPMQALAQVAELLAQNKLVIKVQTFLRPRRRGLSHQPVRPRPRKTRPRP